MQRQVNFVLKSKVYLLQSNPVNTDTYAPIKVFYKRVEFRENVRGFFSQGQSKLSIINNEASVHITWAGVRINWVGVRINWASVRINWAGVRNAGLDCTSITAAFVAFHYNIPKSYMQ